ncbi:MAG: non-hydrolyzing UDP-N-acetylglucosamine 2-epimerase [Woeseiaceae bacterium]
MIKVLTVFGTRPEAIKLAPVVNAFRAAPDRFDARVCLTAQHRQMLDQVMTTFSLTANDDLDLMQSGQSPADVAAAIMQTLPRVLAQSQPDLILVQGDTMTSFAAAFVAYLNRIPIGHIEAGLRTGNFNHPFPEEMNRVLTSRLASLHFAPTDSARDALLTEGVAPETIFVTGNTVIDALLATVDPAHQFSSPELADVDDSRRVVLVTTHRRESFGKPLDEICHAISTLADAYPDCRFVMPVHPNPAVQQQVRSHLSERPNVLLCAPLEYRDFVNLMAKSTLILTDSGGVQEEAPSLDVPVLVMRETTERPEGVTSGCAKLVGTDFNTITSTAVELLDNAEAHREMAMVENPYGDGHASRRIVDTVANWHAATMCPQS